MGDGWKLLLFGGSGTIAAAIARHAIAADWSVVATTRGPVPTAAKPGLT